MKTHLGTILAGGLLLAFCSPSHAQVNVQFGRGGSPNVTFGQPSYGQYPSRQPAYGQSYAQPSYYPQAGSGYVPRTYSSGYSGYAAPVPAYGQGYSKPSYAAPFYQAPYRQQSAYPAYGGFSPYSQPVNGTGMMINGRMYSLPR
jgi:hypothetical protein